MSGLKCWVCGAKNWENLDGLRNAEYWYDRDMLPSGSPVGFVICKACGVVTYDHPIKNMMEEYTRQRPSVSPGHIITGRRKQQYHERFLSGFFADGKMKGKTILDIGCGNGSFLESMQKMGSDKTDLYGTEYAHSMRQYTKRRHGYRVAKEAEEFGKAFDFVSYYHVLEHIYQPDKELERLRALMAPDGMAYISVPIWLDELDQSDGGSTVDFENLYHLNHCNVFSVQSFKNLLKNHGLKIIKTDTKMYAYTVLCIADEAEKRVHTVPENWEDIVKSIKRQRAAISALAMKDYDEAIRAYPKYPDAYIQKAYSKQEIFKDLKAQLEIFDAGLHVMPNEIKLIRQKGVAYLQWDEAQKKNMYSNNVRTAEDLLRKSLAMKEDDESKFILATLLMRYKKDYDEAAKLFREVVAVNPMRWADCEANLCWMDSRDEDRPEE